MDFGFFWTEKSLDRNKITANYEPIQPFVLYEFSSYIGSDCFIDIGANIGFYSLFMSLLPSVSKIYAYEASNETFEHLRANIDLNNKAPYIKPINEAVSDHIGTVKFQTSSPLAGINCIIDTSMHDKSLFANEYSLKSSTLDASFKDVGGRISIKIDVEGHELNVLTGARNFLQNNSCLIQIEIYPSKKVEVTRFLKSLGYYKVFSIENDFYYTNSKKLNSSSVVVDCLEKGCSRLLDYKLNRWPESENESNLLSVQARIKHGELHVACDYNKIVFDSEVEFAFYIIVDGVREKVIWYQSLETISYKIPLEYLGRKISVQCFVRDKKLLDKKAFDLVHIDQD